MVQRIHLSALVFEVGKPLICQCLFVLLHAVLVVRVMSAHDKGSHAEVEVKVKKVLYQNPKMNIQRGTITLYPESWTVQGCTCPILNPGQLQPLPISCFTLRLFCGSILISGLLIGQPASFVLRIAVEAGLSGCQHPCI